MSASLICSSMVTAVRAISPVLHSSDRFEDHDADMDFGEFCEANPASALRRFFIRSTGNVTIESDNSSQRWEETEIEFAICYPRNHRYGDGMGNDRDAMIESDLLQIDNTIGTAGYASLETAVSGTVLTISQSREETDACVFGLLRFRVGYWRATQ